jgi:hypothetical protein
MRGICAKNDGTNGREDSELYGSTDTIPPAQFKSAPKGGGIRKNLPGTTDAWEIISLLMASQYLILTKGIGCRA